MLNALVIFKRDDREALSTIDKEPSLRMKRPRRIQHFSKTSNNHQTLPQNHSQVLPPIPSPKSLLTVLPSALSMILKTLYPLNKYIPPGTKAKLLLPPETANLPISTPSGFHLRGHIISKMKSSKERRKEITEREKEALTHQPHPPPHKPNKRSPRCPCEFHPGDL